MHIIFEVCVEFITILLLFYVLVFLAVRLVVTFFLIYFLTTGKLFYNVTLVSATQQGESAIVMHTSPPLIPPLLVITEPQAGLPVLCERWYIYAREYYSAIKKNEFESVLVRWMNLEPTIQACGISSLPRDPTSTPCMGR